MKTLVFVGGVQGVGKTTFIFWLKSLFGNQFVLINPGELFRHYFYQEQLKTLGEIEEMVVKAIEGAPENSTIVLHWHYAVHRPEGYIPQINFFSLKKIAKSNQIRQIILLLLKAPVNTIQGRRLRDYPTKKRGLDYSIIEEEIRTEEEFLNEHRELFLEILGSNKVAVFHLEGR